jgi:GTPase SAR1 family protein
MPTKENKLLFSVCRKQTEVCHFHFQFEANKQKLPFSISSIFYIYVHGAFRNKVQNLNSMNMVKVRNKLTLNRFSALTRTDQVCHSKCSTGTPSQLSQRNFEVFEFFCPRKC